MASLIPGSSKYLPTHRRAPTTKQNLKNDEIKVDFLGTWMYHHPFATTWFFVIILSIVVAVHYYIAIGGFRQEWDESHGKKKKKTTKKKKKKKRKGKYYKLRKEIPYFGIILMCITWATRLFFFQRPPDPCHGPT